MKRTTLFLEAALESELRTIARRRGQPMAAVVREAMAEYVQRAHQAAKTRLAFEAVGRSGRSDTAERHEERLWISPHGSRRPAARSTRGGARKRPARRP